MLSHAPAPEPSRARRVWFRVAAVLVALLVAGLIAEIALRIGGYDPTYYNVRRSFHEKHDLVGFRGVPNKEGRWRTREFDVHIAINELGFRRAEHQRPLAQGGRRVLVFGDSFAWGWGVGQGQVLTDQISLSRPEWHVANFGLSGIGTVAEFVLFEEYGEKLLRPGDAVVLMLFWNDFADHELRGGTEGLGAELRDGKVRLVLPKVTRGFRLKETLRENSYLFNLIAYWANRLKTKRTMHFLSPPTAERLVITKFFLKRFKEACERKGARFVVVAIPGPTELGLDPVYETDARNQRLLRDTFEECVRDTGVASLDLLPVFLEQQRRDPDELLYYPLDRHWTPTGHRLAAEAITAYLAQSAPR